MNSQQMLGEKIILKRSSSSICSYKSGQEEFKTLFEAVNKILTFVFIDVFLTPPLISDPGLVN
jgi:hypothetical protein